MKYYHASPKRFKIGQILSGNSSALNGQNYVGCPSTIYLTTSPHPHYTIFNKAKNGWHVYEIDLLCKLERGHGIGVWDELSCQQVEIKHYVGKVGKNGGLAKYRSFVAQDKKNGQYHEKLVLASNEINKPRFLVELYESSFGATYAKMKSKKGFKTLKLAQAYADKQSCHYIINDRKTNDQILSNAQNS
jgi:hypothetical protein